MDEEPIAMPMAVEQSEMPEAEGSAHFLTPYSDFLRAALSEDADGQKKAAAILGKLTDAVAEEVNELVADDMGDVLREDGDEGYRVIDDYRDWLCEVLQTANGKEA